MKIISKFKDYYDYLTGIYGVDPLVIYNRRPQFIESNFTHQYGGLQIGDAKDCGIISGEDHYMFGAAWLNFYVCNRLFRVFHYNGQYYTSTKDLIPIYNKMPDGIDKQELKRHLPQQPKELSRRKRRRKWGGYETEDNKPITLNTDLNCPIILVYFNTIYLNPKLEYFGIARFISPQKIFVAITNFLSKRDIEMPSSPQDMYRYEAKGFDKKTSFRPKMK